MGEKTWRRSRMSNSFTQNAHTHMSFGWSGYIGAMAAVMTLVSNFSTGDAPQSAESYLRVRKTYKGL